MFDALFGAGMPLAARFFLAFLIVLGLIGVTAWAVRRFGTGRLGGTSTRGRQPRLAVIDYASVDARRRLILVRRDNVEHLLMIGGPTDVVVESNIVRAVAAPRDMTVARPAGAPEPSPRAIPLPESGNGSWPLQPEPSSASVTRQSPRIEPAPEEPAPWPLQPTADTSKRPQRDTLAALAEELQARPAPQRNRPPASQRGQPVETRGEPRVEQQAERTAESETEPATETHAETRVAAVHPDHTDAAVADQSLAEMAHRLEAALRKPNAQPDLRQSRTPAVSPRGAPPIELSATPPRAIPPEQHAAMPSAPQRAARPAEPKAPRPDGKPTQSKTLYDSLEQEMASLLGRPTNKT